MGYVKNPHHLLARHHAFLALADINPGIVWIIHIGTVTLRAGFRGDGTSWCELGPAFQGMRITITSTPSISVTSTSVSMGGEAIELRGRCQRDRSRISQHIHADNPSIIINTYQ